jgi:hypothetical protein
MKKVKTMIDTTKAKKIAFDFLTGEWKVPPEDRNWFTVFSSDALGEDGHRVKIGIEGFPDYWILDVYDDGQCEPYYDFISPIRDSESNSDLEELPPWVAEVLLAERKHR